jgi:hypothetical protein
MTSKAAEEMSKKPKCRKCIHHRTLPGNTQIQCVNTKAKVEAIRHGVRLGWCSWPFDFDPIWLASCDSFEGKVTVCDRCLMASCWQGHHTCQDAGDAGVKEMTRAELIALNREHPDYWKEEEPCER